MKRLIWLLPRIYFFLNFQLIACFPILRVCLKELRSSFKKLLEPSLTCLKIFKTWDVFCFFSNYFLSQDCSFLQLLFKPLANPFLHVWVNRFSSSGLFCLWEGSRPDADLSRRDMIPLTCFLDSMLWSLC